MTPAKWLFFDLGSTLIDESECVRVRCDEIIEKYRLDRQTFMEKVEECASTQSFAVQAAAKYFGCEVPPWHTEAERLYPEVIEVLDALSRDYRLGIIANQLPGLLPRLDAFGIAKYFDVIAGSADEGFSKPDARLFQIALDRAKCAPADAMMIGDRLDNDIRPAKALGMQTVWVRQGFAQYQTVRAEEETPDFIVERLEDILYML